MIAILNSLLPYALCNNNIISLFISIEIMLLSITLNFIYIGSANNDIKMTIFALFIIILAGAESAIGLSLLISYYRLRGTVRDEL